jgi:hypothetical protein
VRDLNTAIWRAAHHQRDLKASVPARTIFKKQIKFNQIKSFTDSAKKITSAGKKWVRLPIQVQSIQILS